jgi:hypothetical protein
VNEPVRLELGVVATLVLDRPDEDDAMTEEMGIGIAEVEPRRGGSRPRPDASDRTLNAP